ncbi:MAG: DMT family transporter [Clostridia bacterium]|nr:DMT family transporter [Clostridia bacterium]
MKKKKGPFFLFLAAFTWGFCLVGQAEGMEFMGPWSFTAVRLTLGGLSMVALSFFLGDGSYKECLKPGLICAPVILASIMFEQYGLLYTGVGKCAFITAFYIILVPIMLYFLGEKPAKKIWISAILALAGIFFITMGNGFNEINKGDIISLGIAITYAIYIIVVERSAGKVDVVKFSAVQFTAAGLIAFIPAAFIEPGQITLETIQLSIVPILVTGIVSCAFGYTLQILGERDTKADEASLILSSQTVFSLLAGWLLLGEVLSFKEYFGCLIMVIAIVLAVLPERKAHD